MATTISMPYDEEEQRRRRAGLRKKFGGTEGRIAEVSMGNRIVKVPSPRPPVAAGPEGSYMARKLAESRSPTMPMSPTTPFDEMPSAAEKALLLDKIYRYHLMALALMRKESVRRHVRGMVFAGYTYGLLLDPVANIVANAIWYDRAFPPSSSSLEEADAQVVKMLSAKAIFRMACRSLDAIVAFLRHFARSLSTRGAYSCLTSVDGNLQAAVALLERGGHNDPHGGYDLLGGFMAAVQASDLPSVAARVAHLSFVTSYESYNSVQAALMDCMSPWVSPSTLQLAHPVRGVPRESYARWRASLESAGQSSSSPPMLSPSAYRALRLKIHSFRLEEKLSLEIAELALQKLVLQLGEPYELHMICGKSSLIVPPQVYYHINFLASPENGSDMPRLFFAEVRAECKDINDVTLCCPLTENNGRCFRCDTRGAKLIHPANVKFNGAEDQAGNLSLMMDPTSDFHAPLNEDYIFFSLNQHPWTAAFLEANYAHMSDDQVDYSFCWFENYLP